MSPADAAMLFDGARLTLARQLAGLRKSELAKAIDKSPTALAGWEADTKRPSTATVALLAIRLGVDPSFFAVTNGHSDLSIGPVHFRSLRSTSQLARDQASAFGQITAEIATGLETHIEYPEVKVPTHPVEVDDSDGGPERAARLLRHEWRLGTGPVGHLIRLIENHGSFVVFSPPQAASVDAYSFTDGRHPVVVLNPLKRDYYRQRFDLAHELGHLVMHADADAGDRVVEEQAHRFASEFLMPADQIAPLLPKTINAKAWASIARLKEQWGVSMQALLMRARRLGVLSDVSYRNAMTTVSVRGWRRIEPGQIQTLEQPSLLPSAVRLLNREGFDERVLAQQCRAPLELFRAVTSRSPGAVGPTQADDSDASRKVTSLLTLRQ